jgi:homoserine kinase type II
VWHDHVLFEGEIVSGLVDYGSVKRDHVSVDLARLLGSLLGECRSLSSFGLAQSGLWEEALMAYREVHPLSDGALELVQVLDRTGTVLGLTNWLRWLYREGRTFDDYTAVARRMEGLLFKISGW